MEKEEEEVDIPTTLDAASHPNKYTKVSVLYLLLYRNWERENWTYETWFISLRQQSAINNQL